MLSIVVAELINSKRRVSECCVRYPAAMLLPPELATPLVYNTTLHLEWKHFLSQRGRAELTTFTAESAVRLKALRSTQCLVMHAQGLNFSTVRV